MFTLFRQVCPEIPPDSPAGDFYRLLERIKDAVHSGTPEWARNPTLVDYSQICYWAIRKQEYSFITGGFVQLECEAGRPLGVLDVGCGVVPICNWISMRGHQVTAIDPSESEIEFLLSKKLNGFFGSSVSYQTGRAEQLEFSDCSFDVVTCTSVLEHLPAGNDRLALREIARVLKPGGWLLITFDVAPEQADHEGELPSAAHLRRWESGYSPEQAAHLLDQMSGVFDVTSSDLPEELQTLTWDDVHEFWRANQAHDQRNSPFRDYLAIGQAIRRRNRVEPASLSQIHSAYQNGQDALLARLHYVQYHASKRQEIISRLRSARADSGRHEPDGKHNGGMRQRAATQTKQVSRRARLHSPAQTQTQSDQTLQSLQCLQRTTLEHSDMLATLLERMERVETTYREAKEAGEAVAAERLQIIHELTHCLAGNARLLFRVTQRLRPRIFKLKQYGPRPLSVPSHYHRTTPPEDPPSISIVTPSYNQAEFLERTLTSVLDQGYPRLQYVVQDGGSSDDSVELIRRHAHRLFYWNSQGDAGQANAINLGFRHTTGEIMAYLNSDDMLLPGSLAAVARFFANHPDVDLVYGQRIVIDEHDGEVGKWVLPRHDNDLLTWVDYIPQETMFWRRRIWEKAGGLMDENFQFAMDWDLILRFRQIGAKMVRIPRFLGAFRVHSQQKTSKSMADVGKQEMDRLRKRTIGFVPDQSQVSREVRPYLYRHVVCRLLYTCRVLRY